MYFLGNKAPLIRSPGVTSSRIVDRGCVAIVANPYSGVRSNQRLVNELVAALLRHKLKATVLWDPSERRELLADADLERTTRCVVVVGGDGTVADVINEKPRGLPLAVLPAGNENLFARALSCPVECDALVAAIVAGRAEWIDFGRAGPRLFSLMVGVGFDADVVHRVARWRRRQRSLRRVTRLSYLRPILRAFRHQPWGQVDIIADGVAVRGAHCLVFNLPKYGGGLCVAPNARADDGLLDWVVFERPGRAALVRYALAVWRRSAHLERRDVSHGRARHIRIGGSSPVPIQLDGDPAGFTPVEIDVIPEGLAVLMP